MALSSELPYWENRIQSVVNNMAEPSYRARLFTFYTRDDEESSRRSHLQPLNRYSPDVKYDSEGFLYVSSWKQTNRIPSDYKILGNSQDWRNYSENSPVTKISMLHNWDQIKGGIDIGLRRAIQIRDHYRKGGTETGVVMDTFQRLGQLRRELAVFGELSNEDLDRIIEENKYFLEGTPTFTKPRLLGKERIARNLQAGFLDKNGHRNYGAAMLRLYAVELELRKRWEASFPPILAKQGGIVETLEFEREYARQNLVWNQQRLDEAAALRPLGGEDPARFVRRYEQALNSISINLTQNIVVRPYSLGARKAAEILGTIQIGTSDTISARLRAKRTKPTVIKQVRDGNLEGARVLLGESKEALERVLHANEKFMEVKKGLKVKSKAKVVKKKLVEKQLPFIFRH